MPSSSAVVHRPLPARRRWWQLPEGVRLAWPEAASYSSLEPLLFNPFQWVLRYPAQLRASTLLRLPDDFRLLGNLAHGLVERLYRNPGSAEWEPGRVASWFDANLETVVDEEGAVLRMPGRRAELEAFRQRFRPSLLRLHAHLQASGATLIEPEKSFRSDTAIGCLQGISDLVVTTRGGRQVVIDMKWSGLDAYRRKLAEQAHLQLAVYGHLQERAVGSWPAVGYYVLREARLLTPDAVLFPGVEPVALPEGATAQVWQQAVTTWRWRKAQLDAGEIEVAMADIEQGAESVPPEGTLAMQELNPRYNPFVNLAGWAES